MNRLLKAALIVTFAAAPSFAGEAAAPAAAKSVVKKAAPAASSAAALKTDDEKTFYAYGFKLGQNLSPLSPSAGEAQAIAQGLRDAAGGKAPAVDMVLFVPKISEMAQKRVEAKAGAEKEKGKAFADKFSKEPGVSSIPGGGWIKTMTEGSGATPSLDDTVKVHYRGTLIDGTEFDSSYKRNEPTTFPLRGVISCWTNGVSKMKVGGKAKLVCPSDVAYGDQGHPPVIPGGATLVFEVELLDIVKAEGPKMAEPAPAKTPSGKK